MATVKNRAARAGVMYLITHPRSRISRWAARLVVRRVSRRVAATAGASAIPPVRGSRLTTVAGIALVTGAIVLLVRRGQRGAEATPAHPAAWASAPSPAAAPTAAPPESRDAPSTTPTTTPASEAAAASPAVSPPSAPAASGAPALPDGGEDALVARVEAKLSDGGAAEAFEVRANAGVITLRGQVADEEAEARVVRDAEQVEGVKAVQSELQTAPDEQPPPAS